MRKKFKLSASFAVFLFVEGIIFVLLFWTISTSSSQTAFSPAGEYSIAVPYAVKTFVPVHTPYPVWTKVTEIFPVTTTLVPSFTPTPVFLNSTSTPTPNLALLLDGKIVFTCTPEKFNQLCIVDANGDHYARVTSHRANDYYPSLSPTGDKIIFASNQTGAFEVHTVQLDGSAPEQLTHNAGNVTAPEISPDGNWVVYASKQAGDSSIWLLENLTGTPYPVTDAQWNEIDPTWAPDGQHIAFAAVRGGYVELFVMNKDGSGISQVTHDVTRIGGRSSWSPDGKKLVLYAGPQKDRDIYIVDIQSGLSTRLTFGGNNTGPCFSPDGNWIVFSSSRDGDYDLYIMQTDGSGLRQLTFNTYDDWQPRWGR